MSKKENILTQIKTVVESIITGNPVPGNPSLTYENTVNWTDRQFINITPNDIETKPMPWVIVNNEGEEFEPHPGAHFENKIMVQIVGFVHATESSPNLDTLMNSLQRDILAALLSDIQLNHLCSFIMPVSIATVAEMIYPYGGFVLSIDINYTFNSVNL